jgi:hypothetical protein
MEGTNEPMNDHNQSHDLTADGQRIPTLRAYRFPNGDLKVWCRFCGRWHIHGNLAPDSDWPFGSADGHRRPHCVISDSPYSSTGYFVVETEGPPPEPTDVFRPYHTRHGEYLSGYLRAQRRARETRS